MDISLKLEAIYNRIKILEECVKEISSHTPQASTSTEVILKEPNITQRSGGTTLLNTSDGDVKNPTKPYDEYTSNYIPNCLRSEIGKFLSEQKNYTAKKGRSTINLGESYDNSITTEIPETLQKVINLTSDKTINSVTLTRYTGVDNFLPQHSDSTSDIKPGSSILIYTISIGDTCEVKGAESSLTVSDSSMYRMIISSQYYWTHRIDKRSIDPNSVRYSLTLRTVGKYHNSVLIIGDSNTRHVHFYNTPGKRTVLGKEITGKRYPAYHVGEIDATQCIGYRNIIYHVGINATTARGKFRNSMLCTDNNGVRRGTIGKGNASNISASATFTAYVP